MAAPFARCDACGTRILEDETTCDACADSEAPCPRCGGLGYTTVRGEPNAAEPCGCRDDDLDDAQPDEASEWHDYDPDC